MPGWRAGAILAFIVLLVRGLAPEPEASTNLVHAPLAWLGLGFAVAAGSVPAVVAWRARDMRPGWQALAAYAIIVTGHSLAVWTLPVWGGGTGVVVRVGQAALVWMVLTWARSARWRARDPARPRAPPPLRGVPLWRGVVGMVALAVAALTLVILLDQAGDPKAAGQQHVIGAVVASWAVLSMSAAWCWGHYVEGPLHLHGLVLSGAAIGTGVAGVFIYTVVLGDLGVSRQWYGMRAVLGGAGILLGLAPGFAVVAALPAAGRWMRWGQWSDVAARDAAPYASS